jgi:CheY-like chemotaxis protein
MPIFFTIVEVVFRDDKPGRRSSPRDLMDAHIVEAQMKTEGRIVVIEDDESIRQVIRIQLQAAGYDVRAAADGRTGLELIREAPPDLVITDLMMPMMDGHEVCRQIKGHFRTSHIPVIMLTAKSDMPAKVKAFDFGANDFLVKPYEREEMLLRVRNLLAWSRSQREANPLTGLPGNVAIEKEVMGRLNEAEPFLFLYIDIDNFKAYNDHYGYQKGDLAIRLLARLIVEVVDGLGNDKDFVGHVGGDDFVVLTIPEALTSLSDELIRRFDLEVTDLFSPEDRDRGYLKVLNRRGEMEQFALMSLTIAAVPSNKYRIGHLAQLNDLASELKRYGKSLKGSVVVHERRGDGALEAPRNGTDG